MDKYFLVTVANEYGETKDVEMRKFATLEEAKAAMIEDIKKYFTNDEGEDGPYSYEDGEHEDYAIYDDGGYAVPDGQYTKDYFIFNYDEL